MNQSFSRPRVLAVTRDTGFLRSARLEMPLINMKSRRLIEDYFITNPTLFDVPGDFVFDVVWLQRPTNSLLLDLLTKRVGNGFLVDVDDLLIGRPAYIKYELTNGDVVLEAIRRCSVLTVTSDRLAGMYEKALQQPLNQKTIVCPNGYEFPNSIRKPARPAGIILASSDQLALGASRDIVMNAVVSFSKKYNLTLFYFGDEANCIEYWFNSYMNLGRINFWQFHTILSSWPPMIGIAPLETVADPETLEFISAKSDIKMVDFGGFGHPAVYSDSPPYTDTDLRAGVVVPNSREAWTDGLEQIYDHVWNRLDDEQERVIKLRHMNRIVDDFWFPAVLKARLPYTVRGAELTQFSGKSEFFKQAIKQMILNQDHLFRRKLKERMPRSLFWLAKRFLRER